MVEPTSTLQEVSYSDLIVNIQNDNVKSLTFTDSDVKGVFKDGTDVPSVFIFSSSF